MTAPVYERETSSFDRALGFFDAIYAFAVTLLVVNIDVSSREAWQSIRAFFDHGMGSQLLGFLISFLVIVSFWRRNHAFHAGLLGIDSTIVTLNIIGAGLIIFIPFTTQGMSDPHTADLALPTAVYAVNITLAVLLQSVLLELAARRGLLIEPLTARQLRARRLDGLVPPIVLIGSIPVAYLTDGYVAKMCWLILFVVGPLSAHLVLRVDRLSGSHSADADRSR